MQTQNQIQTNNQQIQTNNPLNIKLVRFHTWDLRIYLGDLMIPQNRPFLGKVLKPIAPEFISESKPYCFRINQSEKGTFIWLNEYDPTTGRSVLGEGVCLSGKLFSVQEVLDLYNTTKAFWESYKQIIGS